MDLWWVLVRLSIYLCVDCLVVWIRMGAKLGLAGQFAGQAVRQTDRQTDRQTEGRTERQRDKQEPFSADSNLKVGILNTLTLSTFGSQLSASVSLQSWAATSIHPSIYLDKQPVSQSVSQPAEEHTRSKWSTSAPPTSTANQRLA